MINDALLAYLNDNVSGLSFHMGAAPSNYSMPCCTIDNNGDYRDRFWSNGATVTGLKDQEYELTVWADLIAGGPRQAALKAEELIALLDNYSGPMTDTQTSPNISYRVTQVEASDGGGGYDADAERWGHSVFLTLSYD